MRLKTPRFQDFRSVGVPRSASRTTSRYTGMTRTGAASLPAGGPCCVARTRVAGLIAPPNGVGTVTGATAMESHHVHELHEAQNLLRDAADFLQDLPDDWKGSADGLGERAAPPPPGNYLPADEPRLRWVRACRSDRSKPDQPMGYVLTALPARSGSRRTVPGWRVSTG